MSRTTSSGVNKSTEAAPVPLSASSADGRPAKQAVIPAQHRRHRTLLSAVAAVALSVATLAACGSPHKSAATARSGNASSVASGNSKAVALAETMRTLWEQHMEWTYATVNDFFHDQAALTPTLDRLLQNQRDIGAAIVPYYGQAAGTQLTNLLLTHIEDAVPVLKAVQANNAAQLATANAAWYANAKQIADFLSAANPTNWPKSATEPMMQTHITQTITYSVDLLKGDYAQSIIDYGLAESHMNMMADTLTEGIVSQFPNSFRG